MAGAMAVGEALRQTGGVPPWLRSTPMTAPLPDAATLEARKDRARAWFERLRDDICAAFEALEDALPAGAPLSDRARRPLRAHAVEAHRPYRRSRAAAA